MERVHRERTPTVSESYRTMRTAPCTKGCGRELETGKRGQWTMSSVSHIERCGGPPQEGELNVPKGMCPKCGRRNVDGRHISKCSAKPAKSKPEEISEAAAAGETASVVKQMLDKAKEHREKAERLERMAREIESKGLF